MNKLAATLLVVSLAMPAQAQHHRHVARRAPNDRGRFDILDGQLREDIYRSGFGPLNLFSFSGMKWHGKPFAPGSRFEVNGFWFEVTDFECPEVFTPETIYDIVWVAGRGYFLCSPAWPGVHVSVSVL